MKATPSDPLVSRAHPRRAFERYTLNLPAVIQPAMSDTRRGAAVTAIVTNASLSGLVFVSSRPHPPGSIVEIEIRLGAHMHSVQAVVKRNQLLVMVLPGRRVFQCAAQFVRGDSVTRFIPALARFLYRRFGPNASIKDA